MAKLGQPVETGKANLHAFGSPVPLHGNAEPPPQGRRGAPPRPNSGPSSVHTLAQLGPIQQQRGFQPMSLPADEPQKKGIPYLTKKAKGKYFTQELARHLSQLDSPLNKGYRRSLFDCCSVLSQTGTKLTGKYCNSRWCNTCNRIRTARLINGYEKPLSELTDPYLTTLTVPNVTGRELRHTIEGMTRTYANIVKQARKGGNGPRGVRKLECTYNVIDDTYHPHFHAIVDGQANASRIIDEWMKRHPSASMKGQDMRPADAASSKELFKYVSKIVTKTAGDGTAIIVPALDTIFQAMHGKRTFQPFGGIRMVSEDIEDVQADEYQIDPYDAVQWVWCNSDWVSEEGKGLTGYRPSEAMKRLTTEKMIMG